MPVMMVPVMTVPTPVMMVPMMVPAPMMPMPMSMPVMAPADFLRLQMIDVVLRHHRRFCVFAMGSHEALHRRDRRQWRGVHIRSKRCRAHGYSNHQGKL